MLFIGKSDTSGPIRPLSACLKTAVRGARGSTAVFGLVASLAALGVSNATGGLEETFASDPAERGWIAVGDTNLFEWDASSQALRATWDSSRPNSYFAFPLGTALSREDGFSFAFDLTLSEAVAGNNPEMPNPFQLAVALVNLSRASETNFMRGTGFSSPDLVEFSFFPDPGGAWQWGPSLTATLVDSTGANWSAGGFASAGLDVHETYRITFEYSAAEQALRATILKNGQPYQEIAKATLNAKFTDFSVDHFAICSYSGAGQDPSYSGSIHAVGKIDNVVVTLPESPVGRLSTRYNGSNAEVSFQTIAGWTYVVERSRDLLAWEQVGEPVEGDGVRTTVFDPGPPSQQAYYRVAATRH